MKKLVIVKPGCRDFGNELINHMSISAYGLETGAQVVNHSPFGYPSVLKMLHALYARYIGWRYGKCSLRAWRAPLFLPPTKPLPATMSCDTLYFFGWVFRNPAGIARYRRELCTAFAPSKKVQGKVTENLADLPPGRRYIGIHLRQRPFPGFPEGDFLVPLERTREAIDAYIQRQGLHADEVALCIVSDLPVPKDTFAEYAHRIYYGNTETNFFLLARCSVVIGTNTTFANTAAWFGNVPHIVITDMPVDWAYYQEKDIYFENRYATFAF